MGEFSAIIIIIIIIIIIRESNVLHTRKCG